MGLGWVLSVAGEWVWAGEWELCVCVVRVAPSLYLSLRLSHKQ